MGHLSAGIAHDFNNILASVLGFADLLVQDLPAAAEERRYAERILASARRGVELVQQIRAAAGASQSQRETVDLVPILRGALDLLRRSLPAATQLQDELGSAVMTVRVSPALLGRAIANVVTNAHEALRGHGRLVSVALSTVRAGAAELAGAAGVSTGELDRSQAYARIQVTDTGAGMEPDVLRQIFDPFFTTKLRERGTGLGLAFVYGVVAECDGVCRVESQPGDGTTFRIYLPLSQSPHPPPVAVRPETGAERVLVVDDEPALVKMLDRGLTGLGCVVTTATDPIAAWQLIERDPAAFDIVISDQLMPGMKGTELLARVKALRPSLRFILYSGFPDGVVERTAVAAGAEAFCVKPITARQLAQIIRSQPES
jgi:CheY-like chemotaxis protein